MSENRPCGLSKPINDCQAYCKKCDDLEKCRCLHPAVAISVPYFCLKCNKNIEIPVMFRKPETLDTILHSLYIIAFAEGKINKPSAKGFVENEAKSALVDYLDKKVEELEVLGIGVFEQTNFLKKDDVKKIWK